MIATIPVGDVPGWAETAADGRVCLNAITRSDESFISVLERKEIRGLGHGSMSMISIERTFLVRMGCVGFELGGDRTTNANTLTLHDLPMRFSARDCHGWKAAESRIQTKPLIFNGLGRLWLGVRDDFRNWLMRAA